MRQSLTKPQWVSYSGLFLALALLLPIGFHSFGMGGRVFLPMHLPILLAGFLVGPLSGFLVGLLSPLLSHLLTGMPPSYAVGLMSLELPIYGLVAGLVYRRLKINIYVTLVIAMIVGRLAFGLGLVLLGQVMALPYDVVYFFSAAGPIVAGLPGVALQLVLVPLVVTAVNRRRRTP